MKDKKYIVESFSDNFNTNTSDSGDIFLEGCFTSFGKLNRNNRVYDSKNFLEKLQCLDEKIKNHDLLGELEHPASMRYTSYQNVSHVIESLSYDKESDSVKGRIKLLNTPSGRIARTLIEAHIPLHISSRAIGSMGADNHVIVDELITYDLVAEPGFANAVLHTVNEGRESGYSEDVIDAIKKLDEMKQSKNQAIYESLGGLDLYEIKETKQKNIIESKKEDTAMEDNKNYITKGELESYTKYLSEHLKKMKSGVLTKDELENYPEYLSEHLAKMKSNVLTKQDMETYTEYLREHLDKLQGEFVTEECLEGYTKYLQKMHKQYVTENKMEQYTKYLSESYNKLVSENKALNEKLESIKQYADYLAESQSAINKKLNGSYESIVEASDKTFDQLRKEINEKFSTSSKKSEDDELHALVESVNSIATSINNTNAEIEHNQQVIAEEKELSKEMKLIQYMPDYLKESWSKLSENRKKEILQESKLYVLTTSDSKKEFWQTRNMSEVNTSQNTKAYVAESLRRNNIGIRNDSIQTSVAEEIKRRLKYGF